LPTLLIIYPHWHPANLAGVHRPRLIGNYLPDFGWKVRVLTVEEQYFEETLDPDFHRTFSENFEVTRVRAKKVTKPRIIGDIGLRSMKYIKRKALEIIRTEKIDFVWIPIPSFYMALVGPYLYKRTGVPYGIDYIDPWVRDLTNQRNPRAILSQWIARMLEPKAVKKAALITGVNRKYYEAVLERNKLLDRKPHPVIEADFPYGFDPNDHKIILENIDYPWAKATSKASSLQHHGEGRGPVWLYTGAFLPNSHLFVDLLFKALAEIRQEKNGILENHQFWFIGTGPYPAKRITAYAADHGIQDQVFEIRERAPYLHTLNYQTAADTLMIIGSTEKHYTASKTYQSLLSRRPVFALLHHQSQALEVLKECKADTYAVGYDDRQSETDFLNAMKKVLWARIENNTWNPDLASLEKYSARESARKLSLALEEALEQSAVASRQSAVGSLQ